MHRIARSLVCALALAAPSLHGCLSSHSEPSLPVEVELASATLADDCGVEGAREPGLADCAEGFADCGWCSQSSVQISIAAGDGENAVIFEVVAVRLRATDGALLDELEARNARLYADGAYGIWAEQIEPGSTVRAVYDVSAPDWTAIGNGEPYTTYGMSFTVEVVVRVDGVERILELSPVSREAEIVT